VLQQSSICKLTVSNKALFLYRESGMDLYNFKVDWVNVVSLLVFVVTVIASATTEPLYMDVPQRDAAF